MNQNLLKGMFILLVIVDHNEFSRALFPDFLAGLGFHVMGFMMLPFLRPAPAWDRGILQYVFRLYHPFFVIVTLLALLVAVTGPATPVDQAWRWLHALYSGNWASLKQATHMALLWFLPSFIALVLMRSAIDGAGGALRAAAIGTAWLLHPFIGTVARAVQDYLPLGLLPALYVLPLAYLGILLHRRLFAPLGRVPALALCAALFAAVKACQMHFGFNNEIGFAIVADYRRPLALLCNDAEAVTGVLMLFQASRFPLGRLLEACGRVSLQIYLLHAFVALGVYRLLLRVSGDAAPAPLFAVSLAATVLLTLPLAKYLSERSVLRPLVFPRTTHELLRFLSRSRENKPEDGTGMPGAGTNSFDRSGHR